MKTVEISYKQARKLYKSGNREFIKIALSAYTEEELASLSYADIKEKISHRLNHMYCSVTTEDKQAMEAVVKLGNIAAFFNKEWRKKPGVTGFFIIPNYEDCLENTVHGFLVGAHACTTIPGVVYFKDREDAYQAIEIAHREGWLEKLMNV